MTGSDAAAAGRGTPPAGLRHVVIHRDPHAYCSHPSVLRLRSGEWLIAFLESMRRDRVLHSPADPRFYTLLARSRDEGATWFQPYVIPSYDWYGVECPSLTQLANGELLHLQWRWRWWPRPLDRPTFHHLGLYEASGYPWTRGNDGAYVHRSRDEGHTWRIGARLDTSPYSGAYTMRSAAELPDGALLYAVTDIPNWRQIYLLRSSDGGATWQVGALVASRDDRQFSEPCILRVGPRLVVLIREEVTGYLHQTISDDGGETWSEPAATPMWGWPPQLLDLEDGRLLCVYGHRRPPYGIRGCLSHDGGASWQIDRELVLRDDLPNGNLGYPASLLAAPGRVFSAYYAEDAEGVTCIQGCYYEV